MAYEKVPSSPSRSSEPEMSEYCDSERALLSPGSDVDFEVLRYRGRSERSRCGAPIVTLLNVLLFVMSATLFILLPFRHDNELNSELKKVSAWSPVLDSARIPLVDTQVSGKLFPAEDGSDGLGRAEPGPETDRKWWDFEHLRMFAVPSETIRKLGKDPEKTIKFPEDYGKGDDAYMITLDVYHQIHCLNQLRHEAFKEYYYDGEKYHEDMYGPTSKHNHVHTEFFWIHLRHCTDMLLQSLMCHADTEMITMTWMETQENPWPDFSVNKKCKSFDALQEWRDANSEPRERIKAMKKPHDLTKIDEHYKALFGYNGSEGDNTHHPTWEKALVAGPAK